MILPMDAAKPPTETGPLVPAWDVARIFPPQGEWGEGEYLLLPTNRLVELIDGHVEVLPLPTHKHQAIVFFLCQVLRAFVAPGALGKTVMAAFPVRLRDRHYREPDVAFMLAEHTDRCRNEYWNGADLVFEVVSENRRRDLEEKRIDYADAGIPEYWIIDPRDERILVLKLNDRGEYATAGEYRRGQRAASVLLPGFEVGVDEALDAEL